MSAIGECSPAGFFCTAEIRQLSRLIVRRNMINGKIYPERWAPERFASEWIMNSSDVNKGLCLYIPVFEFSSVTHWFYKPWLSMRNPSPFTSPALILTFPQKPLTLPQLLIHPTKPRAHPDPISTPSATSQTLPVSPAGLQVADTTPTQPTLSGVEEQPEFAWSLCSSLAELGGQGGAPEAEKGVGMWQASDRVTRLTDIPAAIRAELPGHGNSSPPNNYMMLWGKTSFPSTQPIYQQENLFLTQMAAVIGV